MVPTKTNNSFYADKVNLRSRHLPEGAIRILDCFGGDGLIWRKIQKNTGREIYHLPIDILDYGKFHLPGNNLKYLQTMDLTPFNIIDLDAYGVPYKQLKILFDRKYHGTVFVTFIQSIFGGLPKGMMKDIGFTETMIKTCPTLCHRNGFDKFKEWLAMNEVKEIVHISPTSQKHYICFKM